MSVLNESVCDKMSENLVISSRCVDLSLRRVSLVFEADFLMSFWVRVDQLLTI